MTNPQMQSEQAFADGRAVETAVSEEETLARLGFDNDEIMSLLWLHQWYQHGGSDRVEIVRRLEFLKQRIAQGQVDL